VSFVLHAGQSGLVLDVQILVNALQIPWIGQRHPFGVSFWTLTAVLDAQLAKPGWQQGVQASGDLAGFDSRPGKPVDELDESFVKDAAIQKQAPCDESISS